MAGKAAALALAALMAAPMAGGAARAQIPAAADIAPIQSLAARVMQGAGAPALITPAGVSPHAAALRPSQAAALARARVVFRVGKGFSPAFDRALAALAPEARVVSLLEAPGMRLLPMREGGTGPDPHAWLDPANARAFLAAAAEALAAEDPANAARYRANAQAGRAELAALAAGIDAALAPVRARPFAVFHDAFRYFETRFGLNAIGALAAGDAADPGPARVAAMRARIIETGAACVFSEPQLSARRLRTIVEGTGARAGRLDPLGAGLTPGPGLYPAMMRALAHDLAACLSAP